MEEYKLSDIAEVRTGPFGSQLHNEDYVSTGTPIVTVEHLGNSDFQNKICHWSLMMIKRGFLNICYKRGI